MAMSASNCQLAAGRALSATSTIPLRTAERLTFFSASAAVCPATTCRLGPSHPCIIASLCFYYMKQDYRLTDPDVIGSM